MSKKRTTTAPKKREQVDRDAKRLYPNLDVYDLPFGIKVALLLIPDAKKLEGYEYLPSDVKELLDAIQVCLEVGATDMIERLSSNKELQEKAEAFEAYLTEQDSDEYYAENG